jgi:hypothetical protein
MQMDTFFTIGKSHKVCEDYAICQYDADGLDQMIAISDGCSSSKDTDFGSRILLKSLVNHIAPHTPLLARGLWSNAKNIVQQLHMPTQCLDATINFAFTGEQAGVKGIEVITIGDGFIVAQQNDGGFEIVEIEFDRNAPYYLSYEFNSDRKQEFMKLGQQKIVTVKEYDVNCVLKDSYISDTDDNKIIDRFSKFWFPLEVYKSVSVFSDGLKTFIPHDQTQPKVPLEQIVKELISFPQTNGEFVKRRCLKFMKNHVESSFYDDFSMATLVRD